MFLNVFEYLCERSLIIFRNIFMVVPIFVFHFVIFRPHIARSLSDYEKKNKYKKLTLKCYIDKSTHSPK